MSPGEAFTDALNYMTLVRAVGRKVDLSLRYKSIQAPIWMKICLRRAGQEVPLESDTDVLSWASVCQKKQTITVQNPGTLNHTKCRWDAK
jgi:hypothetical protein